MNLLGVDYGKKRIGLAWMQDGLDIILPFGVLENKGTIVIKNELKKIIEEEHIDTMIIGFPMDIDGNDTNSTQAVRIFIEDMKSIVDIPIELVDERFSTAQAKHMGGDARLDEKAAMLILQSYLKK